MQVNGRQRLTTATEPPQPRRGESRTCTSPLPGGWSHYRGASSPAVPRSQPHLRPPSLPLPCPQIRSPVRSHGAEQAQGGQAPGADERPPRHRRRQGDRRQGRLRLPAQHLAQEDGRRRGDLRRGPQEGRRLHREVRGDAGRGLHLHRRRLPRHRQRQAEPADGVYKG